MTPAECPRGQAVVTAVVSGRWHEPRYDDVRDHAATCEACQELVAVATLFREDREHLGLDASLPAAGQIWWRSAIRGRLEAQRAAARPLLWLYGAAIATALGVTAAVARLLMPVLDEASERLALLGADLSVWGWVGSLAEAAQPALPFVLGVAAALVLLLVPLLFVALSDD